MIIQACINGARSPDFHPALPLNADAMAQDSAECIAVGAAELHVHPRGEDGRESLSAAAMDKTVLAIRKACPGTFISVSTGAWIEKSAPRTLQSIGSWNELPDYASVNLSEIAAPDVMELLQKRGIGIEAGLASTADATRFVKFDIGRRALRVLIEIEEQDIGEAQAVVGGIVAILDRAEIRRPILLHGFDATIWHFVEVAAGRRWSTRIGLEDGRTLPDGKLTANNAAMIAAARSIRRKAMA